MKGIAVVLFVALTMARAQVDECPPEQETNWEIEKLLRHEDCNKFYKCTFGKPVEYSCYEGLYFNLDTWECDWPHNVDCDGRNDPAATTTADTSTTTTTTPPTSTTITPAPTTTTTRTTTPAPTTTTTTTTTTPVPTSTTTTTTTPVPTSTTTTTTTPVPTTTTTTTTTTTPTPTTTTTTTTSAPTTSSTTTQTPECEIEINPSSPKPDEDGGNGGQEEEEEEEEDRDIEFLPNGCPVDPHIHWLLPHKEDCTKFYYCVWGDLVLRECGANTHFNPVLQVCDWPHAAGCTASMNKHAEVRRQLLQQILA